MTDAPSALHYMLTGPTARATSLLRPPACKTLLVIVVAGSIALSVSSIGSDAPAKAGSDLTHLLRFMAALKAVLAVAVLAAVFLRLAAPVTPARLASYIAASGVMSAGPGLIWGVDHVGFGALLLHGGLVATVLVLWRDPATASLLTDRVQARSRRR